MRRRDPRKTLLLRVLERNRSLETELVDAMRSVVEKELEILGIRDELDSLRKDYETLQSETGHEDVPVRGAATCNCTTCQRGKAEITLRELTPLHGLQLRGFSFGISWGVA